MRDIDLGMRLKTRREQCFKTPQEIAAAAGISACAYYDLEAGHDWYEHLSLNQIRLIADAIDISPPELLFEIKLKHDQSISLNALRQRLNSRLRDANTTIEDLENRICWSLAGFKENLAVASSWNLDCLRAFCRALDIDWRRVSFFDFEAEGIGFCDETAHEGFIMLDEMESKDSDTDGQNQ